MKKNKKIKVAFAASSGGHFEQLMMLKPLMDKYDSFIITEKTKYQLKSIETRGYYLHQVNRKEKLALFFFVLNTLYSVYIFFKERPDYVICTGVLAMIPICFICKISGKKLIYIESFAKVNSPTKSGKFLYKFSDKFYVQWEELLSVYPDAIYLGSIY